MDTDIKLPIPDPGFTKKYSMTNMYKRMHHFWTMISQVHELGAIKYACFSFQNDPEGSNATVSDCLDAMWRHYLLCTTGQIQDVEGFPHIYHLVTRSHMFITTWYKEHLGYDKPHKPDIRALSTLLNPSDDYALGFLPVQLSSEGLISLLKWEPILFPVDNDPSNQSRRYNEVCYVFEDDEPNDINSATSWALFVQAALYQATQNCIHDNKIEPQALYNDINYADRLYMYILCFAKYYMATNHITMTDKHVQTALDAKRESRRNVTWLNTVSIPDIWR